ncbi:MAG: energy-coupling factor ABC transporter substrate-binding protein [Methanobacterium sp.]
MVDKKPVILLCLVVVIAIIPLALYSGMGNEQGYFSGSDDAAGKAIEETGYQPWFSSIWKPPSDEIESLIFSLQAAIGAIIVGFILGYYTGQSKERKKMENKLLKNDSIEE